MAKGRFISRSIGHSREIAALPDDTSRMVFAFILPYLDVEGRIDADPVYLAGVCLSRLQIPPETIARALVAMFEVGLIELYEEYGLPCLQYVNFEKHQQGLRKDRENASALPEPSGRFPSEFEPFLKVPPLTEPAKGTKAVQEGARSVAGALPQTPESPAEDSPPKVKFKLKFKFKSKPKSKC